jgi:hypothetical protein
MISAIIMCIALPFLLCIGGKVAEAIDKHRVKKGKPEILWAEIIK